MDEKSGQFFFGDLFHLPPKSEQIILLRMEVDTTKE